MADWVENLGLKKVGSVAQSWANRATDFAAKPGTIGLVGAALNIPQSFGVNPDNLIEGKSLEFGHVNPMLAVSGVGLLVGAHIFRELGKGKNSNGVHVSKALQKLGGDDTKLLQMGLGATMVANAALMKFGVDIGTGPAEIMKNLASNNISSKDIANPFVAHSMYLLVSGFSAFLTTPFAKKVMDNPDAVAAKHAKFHAGVSTVAGSLVGVLGHNIDSKTLTVVGALYAGEAMERYGAIRTIRDSIEAIYSAAIRENQGQKAVREAQRRADPSR